MRIYRGSNPEPSPRKKNKVAMAQGHRGNILSGAQYHLKTVHLFSRADYLTVIPTVKPFQLFQIPCG